MKLSYILKDAGISGDVACDLEVMKIEVNTKNLTQKSAGATLFVCISGASYDSHKDVDSLLEMGIGGIIVSEEYIGDYADNKRIFKVPDTRKALALLARAFFGHPEREIKAVGVTGTKGKTTVTYMLSSILKREGKKCGIIGTNGIIYGSNLIETINTTPGSLEIYSYLREMVNCGIEYVICEVTSQALKQYRTYGITFEAGAFTCFFSEHIGKGEHESIEEYRECKSRLFSSCCRAALNGEDNETEFFEGVCQGNGVPYEKFYPSRAEKKLTDALRLPGAYNISNAVCAETVAKALGVDEKSILEGIKTVNVPGRCERVASPEGVNIVIDYAHEKESLGNILKALRCECRGRLICVFGAGGDRARARRYGMGEAATSLADLSIVTTDNPRSENPNAIISDILCGINADKSNYVVIPNRKKAIFFALGLAREGDTVLLAGKGAQTFEEVCGKRISLDERKIVAEFYGSITQ